MKKKAIGTLAAVFLAASALYAATTVGPLTNPYYLGCTSSGNCWADYGPGNHETNVGFNINTGRMGIVQRGDANGNPGIAISPDQDSDGNVTMTKTANTDGSQHIVVIFEGYDTYSTNNYGSITGKIADGNASGTLETDLYTVYCRTAQNCFAPKNTTTTFSY